MNGGFLAGLLVGAVAGSAVALLSSPRSGRENRELVKEKAPELPEQAPRLAQRAGMGMKERLDAAREAYRQGSSETRQRMQRELDASQGGPPARP